MGRVIYDTDLIERMPHIESEGLSGDILDEVAQAIERLPEELRDVVNAYFSERLSYRAIAKRMGYASHSTAFYKLKKALKVLKKELYEVNQRARSGNQSRASRLE